MRNVEVSWFPGQHIRSSFANFTNILTVHVWEQLWLKPQPKSTNVAHNTDTKSDSQDITKNELKISECKAYDVICKSSINCYTEY